MRISYCSSDVCSSDLELMSQVSSEHSIRYYFAIFDLRGNRVAWVTSPTDTFKAGSGGKRSISVTLSPLLLGGGNYILSVSIFDAIKENRVSAARSEENTSELQSIMRNSYAV